MSARKQRPTRGTPVAASMSERDIAAALGVSTGALSRWKRLAAIPAPEFERRLTAQIHAVGAGRMRAVSASTILAGEPVSAPGRVARAIGLYRKMTQAERERFFAAAHAIEADA